MWHYNILYISSHTHDIGERYFLSNKPWPSIQRRIIILDIQSVYSVISRERKVKPERTRGTELRVKREKQGDWKDVGGRVKRLLFVPRRKENNVLGLLSLSAGMNCAKWLARDRLRGVNWIHVKIRKGVNGFKARKAEESNSKKRFAQEKGWTRVTAPAFRKEKDGGTAGGGYTGAEVRSRVCKTENEAGDGKEEERVSGWFIESLSGAVDSRGGRRRRRGVYIAFRRRSLI